MESLVTSPSLSTAKTSNRGNLDAITIIPGVNRVAQGVALTPYSIPNERSAKSSNGNKICNVLSLFEVIFNLPSEEEPIRRVRSNVG